MQGYTGVLLRNNNEQLHKLQKGHPHTLVSSQNKGVVEKKMNPMTQPIVPRHDSLVTAVVTFKRRTLAQF